MSNDRTQIGAGPTMQGAATVALDPNRTQMATPPPPGAGGQGGTPLLLSVRVGAKVADARARGRWCGHLR
ncbi:MAG TPA: hypothetical protein VM490_25645, partial [Armatimonadaceae bacterium]|nr:hypothetical protein [Armatimonadaceae bacterium]